jgi:hypothetical protein
MLRRGKERRATGSHREQVHADRNEHCADDRICGGASTVMITASPIRRLLAENRNASGGAEVSGGMPDGCVQAPNAELR